MKKLIIGVLALIATIGIAWLLYSMFFPGNVVIDLKIPEKRMECDDTAMAEIEIHNNTSEDFSFQAWASLKLDDEHGVGSCVISFKKVHTNAGLPVDYNVVIPSGDSVSKRVNLSRLECGDWKERKVPFCKLASKGKHTLVLQITAGDIYGRRISEMEWYRSETVEFELK